MQELQNLPAVRSARINSRAVLVWLFTCCLFCTIACEKRKAISTTPDMDAAADFWIRVLLFDNLREFTLSARDGFIVIDETTGTRAHFGKQCGPVVTAVMEGGILIGEHVFGGEVAIEPVSPFVFSVGDSLYRGNLKLMVNDDAETMDAINSLPVESYLAGVVGSEMPSYWESEALKAQTVAARTYCLFIKYRFGGGRKWDVRRNQANQVYGGIGAESPMVWDAVEETAGDVLSCIQEIGEKIFPTYYSSTCGGHTANSENVFGDSYATLKGVRCPYCRQVARKSFYEWGEVRFDAASASRRIIDRYPRFRSLGRIVNIEPDEVADYGDFTRVASLILTGQNGRQKTLRAEDLRLTVDSSGRKIKSNSYRIEKKNGYFVFSSGRGFGHCVGMCQYGAEGMARKGKSHREILAFYYPGSRIRSIY